MSLKTVSNFDGSQIERQGFDDVLQAHRVVVIGENSLARAESSTQVQVPNKEIHKETVIERIEVPIIIKETVIERIEVPKIVKEYEVLEVRIPQYVVQKEYKDIEKIVVVPEVKIVEVPTYITQTEIKTVEVEKKLSKFAKVCMIAQTLAVIIIAIRMIWR